LDNLHDPLLSTESSRQGQHCLLDKCTQGNRDTAEFELYKFTNDVVYT